MGSSLRPGEKQPPHPGPQEIARETVDALEEFSEKISSTETYGPSSERAKQPGNLNPTPPEERKRSLGPMQTAAADIAAGHIAAATTAITAQADAERRLQSDPRYERDQKVFEMGQMGRLGLVPPSEAERATMAARAGVPEEAIDKIPTTAEEQVAEDMSRLDQANQRAEEGVTGTAATPAGSPAPISGGVTSPRSSAVRPGEQENNTPPNNLQAVVDAGKQVGGAEGEAQNREEARRIAEEEASATKGTVIK